MGAWAHPAIRDSFIFAKGLKMVSHFTLGMSHWYYLNLVNESEGRSRTSLDMVRFSLSDGGDRRKF